MKFKVGDIVTVTENSSKTHPIYSKYIGKPLKITEIYTNFEDGGLLIKATDLTSNKFITPCFIYRVEFFDIKEEDVL